MKELEIKKLTSGKYAVISCATLPSQANAYGNVHGGEIMKLMDSAAWCASCKYAHSMAVTARVEELIFHMPVMVGQLLTCFAEVIYTGNSSMIVYVRVEMEDISMQQDSITALTGIFTMVAIDENRRPHKVPQLPKPTDPEELALYNLGKERYLANKSSNK